MDKNNEMLSASDATTSERDPELELPSLSLLSKSLLSCAICLVIAAVVMLARDHFTQALLVDMVSELHSEIQDLRHPGDLPESGRLRSPGKLIIGCGILLLISAASAITWHHSLTDATGEQPRTIVFFGKSLSGCAVPLMVANVVLFMRRRFRERPEGGVSRLPRGSHTGTPGHQRTRTSGVLLKSVIACAVFLLVAVAVMLARHYPEVVDMVPAVGNLRKSDAKQPGGLLGYSLVCCLLLSLAVVLYNRQKERLTAESEAQKIQELIQEAPQLDQKQQSNAGVISTT